MELSEARCLTYLQIKITLKSKNKQKKDETQTNKALKVLLMIPHPQSSTVFSKINEYQLCLTGKIHFCKISLVTEYLF